MTDRVTEAQREAIASLPSDLLDMAVERLAVIQNIPKDRIRDEQLMALLGDTVAVMALAFIAEDQDNRTYGEAVRRIMAQADVTWSDLCIKVQEAG